MPATSAAQTAGAAHQMLHRAHANAPLARLLHYSGGMIATSRLMLQACAIARDARDVRAPSETPVQILRGYAALLRGYATLACGASGAAGAKAARRVRRGGP